MFEALQQYSEKGFWILQAVVGLIFIVHGAGKLKNPAGIAGALGMPKGVGLLHGLIEVVGGIMLIVNFHPKTVSIVFGLIILGAIYFKKFKWGVPFVATNNTGWEFDLVLLASSIAILVH